jgi:hypothetical protein
MRNKVSPQMVKSFPTCSVTTTYYIAHVRGTKYPPCGTKHPDMWYKASLTWYKYNISSGFNSISSGLNNISPGLNNISHILNSISPVWNIIPCPYAVHIIRHKSNKTLHFHAVLSHLLFKHDKLAISRPHQLGQLLPLGHLAAL